MTKAIQTAAIYGRISTADGRQDVESQMIQLRDYCQRQGWTIAQEFVDHASGKRSDNRRQFQAMLTAASRREFDVLVTWALDRLSREGVLETFEHIKRLKGFGVEYESYTEPQFRTSGPAGELMLAVSAWIAQMERQRIAARTRAGMERVRREGTRSGKAIGRPRKIMDRLKVREMHRQGKSLRQIAVEVGTSHATIVRALAATA
jgi:DNA invertase Pin-like site-specific DNA recombinase